MGEYPKPQGDLRGKGGSVFEHFCCSDKNAAEAVPAQGGTPKTPKVPQLYRPTAGTTGLEGSAVPAHRSGASDLPVRRSATPVASLPGCFASCGRPPDHYSTSQEPLPYSKGM